MDTEVNILGFAGSLRRGSYNRGLLRAAAGLLPAGAHLETVELGQLPLFNQDMEIALPPAVREFKDKIKQADAVLIATPEHNYSIPGVLKNAIDWASRPQGDNSLSGKPAAIMSASTGMLGGARAQYHLRQSFVSLNMYPLNRPEVMVPFAAQKFDGEGRLADEKTLQIIRELLTALVAWTRRLRQLAGMSPST